MADNVTLNAGSGGSTVAADDIGGVQYPRSKIVIGADGTNDGDVSATNPLPIRGTGTAGTANANVLTVQGIASMTAIAVSQSGTWDEVGINDSGNSITVDNGGTFPVQVDGAALTALQLIDNAISGAGFNITQQGGVNVSLNTGVRDTGTQRVTIATDDIVPASQSGTWTVGLSAAQTLATVTTVGTVTTCSTVTTVSTLTGSSVAHDGVDAGNPHKIGARAALTLSDDTMVANADRTDCVSDGDAALITRPQFPLADLISERVSNTDGTSTAFTNFGATASTRNVVTAIVCWNASSTAGYIDFRDGAAGAILFTVPIPATGGVVLPAGATPYFKTTANTALAYDVSGALTTVYISISGFKSKVV